MPAVDTMRSEKAINISICMNIRRRMVGKIIPERSTEKLTAADKADITIKAISILLAKSSLDQNIVTLFRDCQQIPFLNWYRTLLALYSRGLK